MATMKRKGDVGGRCGAGGKRGETSGGGGLASGGGRRREEETLGVIPDVVVFYLTLTTTCSWSSLNGHAGILVLAENERLVYKIQPAWRNPPSRCQFVLLSLQNKTEVIQLVGTLLFHSKKMLI